jgi:hypothetical protein
MKLLILLLFTEVPAPLPPLECVEWAPVQRAYVEGGVIEHTTTEVFYCTRYERCEEHQPCEKKKSAATP